MGGFVLISWPDGAAPPRPVRAWTDHPPRGWGCAQIGPGLCLLHQVDRPCALARTGGDLVLGWLVRAPAGGLEALARMAFLAACGRLQAETWGDYVFVRREPGAGRLSAYRDPGGGMEAAAWRAGSTFVCASALPPWLDPLLPADLALDGPRLAAMAANPTLQTAGCALAGVHALTPGEAWVEAVGRQLWRPADVLQVRPPRRRTRPAALAAVVRDTVSALAKGRVLLEISGGLDSAIVAGCLPGGRLAAAVNYFVGDRQGDERGFARQVAARAGVALTEVEKTATPLDLASLAAASDGLRPALNRIDHAHDADIAKRCRRLKIDVLMTGQGGDDIFFQTPTPLIVADGFRHGLPLGELCGLARWQSRSVYALWRAGARAALQGPQLQVRRPDHVTAQAWALAQAAAPHPWLTGLEHAAPAKALQVAGLANALIVKAGSARGEAAALRHPLLAQPVVEYGLGVSVPDLTRGRDRGLARAAFAEVVPAEILERVTKGRLSAHYGRMLAAALGEIRPLLLDGDLARRGIVDPEVLDRILTVEHLIWRGGYGAIINLVMLELWVRAWTLRLAGLRAARRPWRPSRPHPAG